MRLLLIKSYQISYSVTYYNSNYLLLKVTLALLFVTAAGQGAENGLQCSHDKLEQKDSLF